jgi:hypothetical protein
MSEDLMLKCLIAFILGWLVSRMMGNGFSVSCSSVKPEPDCNTNIDNLIEIYYDKNHEEHLGNEKYTSRLHDMYKTEMDLDNFNQCIIDNNQRMTDDINDWQNSNEYLRTTFKGIVNYWWESLN